MRNNVYWLALYGQLSVIIYRTQDHLPRDSATQIGLDLPTSIINQENAV